MAISGDHGVLSTPSLNLNVDDYSKAVGELQGEHYKDAKEYGSSDGWGGDRLQDNFDKDTVAGASGAYVLKGKAGITPDFYQRFSNAFDAYEATIVNDLKKLETNPTIGQAFRGTEIEKSIKNLIVAVEAEARDYLFKLKQREKTVIESVKRAFDRQHSKMGSSMQSDTEKLKQGNSSTAAIDAFNEKAGGWYDGTRIGSN